MGVEGDYSSLFLFLFMRTISRLLATALLGSAALGTAVPTLAQDARTLDEVVVTANKSPQKQSQTGKVVTVLPDSVLQRYASQTVSQLLTRQAGLMIVGAQGPLGSNQDVYMRGASVGNTLILLDGVPVYDPSGTVNAFDLNLITVGECERIEILKGAQSTAYGSDAVAGVISISTRNGRGKRPLQVSATAQYGTYNTFRGGIGLSGATDKVSYNLQYTRLSSTGFSVATDRENTGTFDKDGYRQNALLGNVAVTLNPQLTLKLRGLTTAYQTDLDAGAFGDEKDYTSRNRFSFGSADLEWTHQRGKLVANYGVSGSRRIYKDDSTSVEPSAFDKYSYSTYGGLTHFAELYHTLTIHRNIELLTGADYRFANTDQTYRSVSSYGLYESPPLGADTARTNQVSFYTSGVWRTQKGLSVELGGRYNHHSVYGNAFTYSFNPSYLIQDQVKLFANLSSGFRAPSLYQIFSPYGNRALKPERSQSIEAGVQVFTKLKNAWVRALYFDRRVRDVIFFQSLSVPPYTSLYINFDRQHDHGWEFDGQAQLGKLSLTGNLTLLDGRVTTQASGRDTTYNNLFRRPKVLTNLTAGYQITSALFASAAFRSVGSRIDRFYNATTFATENVTLAPYSTVDLYAEYRLKQIRLYADVQNLFDKQYADSYGYNTRRRTVNIGVRVSW
jgi:vitamin B12 transporter